jgi:NitT/TauT family transport system substrate-binding protein
MTIRRSQFLLTATAGAVAFVPGLPARADDALRIGALLLDNTAQVFYARELGMFKRAGLNVDIQTFPSGGAASSALVGGAVDIAIADLLTMAEAHARAVPLTYLAPATVYTKALPAYELLVAASSPIRVARDFNGKTVAVNALKNILQVPTEAWLDNNGGDAKSVKFVEVPFPTMAAAILDGRVDAASISEPFFTNALDTGNFRKISVSDKNVAPEFMFSGWATTVDFAAKHPDVVKKFVAVMLDAARWGNANHAQSAQILVGVNKMPADVANKMERSYYGEKLSPALLQPVIDAAAKYGATDKTFPASEVISIYALR